jgi:hypothetical protein
MNFSEYFRPSSESRGRLHQAGLQVRLPEIPFDSDKAGLAA